jgi:hypothetical protein
MSIPTKTSSPGSRLSDSEMNAYFGGRAAFLSMQRENLKIALNRLASGFAADRAKAANLAGNFTSLIPPQSEAEWVAKLKSIIRQLELILEANV